MVSKPNGTDVIKAILLLSGGLDSTLAARIVKDQGVELWALNFVTPFCMCTRQGCRSEAKKVAEELGIEIKIFAVGEEYIQMVKGPKHGYGKNMNPCIDCRIFMFSRARRMMQETGALFVVTGDVLGERPMSQRLWAMRTIERESDLDGLVVRPLSAKLLKPTVPEMRGWLDRGKLLAIRGRSRKPQMALAEAVGVRDYPCPAGGCRLTDPHFAVRFRDALDHGEDSLTDIHLLKLGRHFRFPSGAKVIVGRNERENRTIEALAPPNSFLVECAEDAEGPTSLLRRANGDQDVVLTGALTLRYSDHPEPRGKVQIREKGGKGFSISTVSKMGDGELVKHRI